VHLVGFIKKKFVTMHGDMNVKVMTWALLPTRLLILMHVKHTVPYMYT